MFALQSSDKTWSFLSLSLSLSFCTDVRTLSNVFFEKSLQGYKVLRDNSNNRKTASESSSHLVLMRNARR